MLNISDWKQAVSDLQSKGLKLLDQRLDHADVIDLRKFAYETSCFSDNDLIHVRNPQLLTNINSKAPRLFFREADLASNHTVQKLMTDPVVLKIAQEYLDCAPIFDFVTAWWTTGANSEPDSHAAQLFHFDYDRSSFLKFFFYLSDVGVLNGPHVYVPKTHNGQTPQRLREDRRFSDEEVSLVYPAETWREIIGPSGTGFIADTVGLHKGTVPRAEGRLILQFEFCSNFFGGPVDSLLIEEKKSNPTFVETVRTHPYVFQKIFLF